MNYKPEDLRIDCYRTGWGPATITITHIPTGIWVKSPGKHPSFIKERELALGELRKKLDYQERYEGLKKA